MRAEVEAATLQAGRRPWNGCGLLSGRALKGVLGLLIVLAVWQASVPLIGLPDYF